MNVVFSETLRRLREEKGFSQKQLADAAMILRLAKCLDVDANTLLQIAAQSEETPNIIMVDDSKVILSEGVAILEEALPNATIAGFIWPREAIEYAKMNRIAMAVLDIELGASSGLDLCHTLLEINPHTNIIFLTAYADYSLDAWQTGASGFILKPMTPESLKEQMNKLRYPLSMAGAEDRVIASL